MYIISSNIETLKTLSHGSVLVCRQAVAISNYGKTNNIPAYILNDTRRIYLLNNIDKFAATIEKNKDEILKDYDEIIKKHGIIDSKDIPSEKLIPVLERINNCFGSAEDYEFFDKYFDFLISQNSMYMTYIRLKI